MGEGEYVRLLGLAGLNKNYGDRRNGNGNKCNLTD
jgi:hypothetical protein